MPTSTEGGRTYYYRGILATQSGLDTVSSTASGAASAASTAQSTADSAASAASTAQSTADSASTAASNAASAASTAQSTADSAASAASTAQSTATTADGKADTAISTANAADTKADTALAGSIQSYTSGASILAGLVQYDGRLYRAPANFTATDTGDDAADFATDFGNGDIEKESVSPEEINAYAKQQYYSAASVTYTATTTVTPATSVGVASGTLTQSITLAVDDTNAANGMSFIRFVTQDATGSRTVTAGSGLTDPSGLLANVASGAGTKTRIMAERIDGTWYVVDCREIA